MQAQPWLHTETAESHNSGVERGKPFTAAFRSSRQAFQGTERRKSEHPNTGTRRLSVHSSIRIQNRILEANLFGHNGQKFFTQLLGVKNAFELTLLLRPDRQRACICNLLWP